MVLPLPACPHQEPRPFRVVIPRMAAPPAGAAEVGHSKRIRVCRRCQAGQSAECMARAIAHGQEGRMETTGTVRERKKQLQLRRCQPSHSGKQRIAEKPLVGLGRHSGQAARSWIVRRNDRIRHRRTAPARNRARNRQGMSIFSVIWQGPLGLGQRTTGP